MSILLNHQQEFTVAIAKLILHAESLGIKLTFGDAYRDPRLHGQIGEKKAYGSANSCHKLRLAVDFNIIKDGKLLGEDAHKPLHDYWSSIGGSKVIPGDYNHYSFEFNNYR